MTPEPRCPSCGAPSPRHYVGTLCPGDVVLRPLSDPMTAETCAHCGLRTLRPDGICRTCGGDKHLPPDPRVAAGERAR